MNQCAVHIEPVGDRYRVFLIDAEGYQLGYGAEHLHPTLAPSEQEAKAIGDSLAKANGRQVVAYLTGEYAPYRDRKRPTCRVIQVGVWTKNQIFKAKSRSRAWIRAGKTIIENMDTVT